MADYEPTGLPKEESPVLAAAVEEQLRQIAEAIRTPVILSVAELHAEPDKPRDGMIVLADGTNWNPGSGAGFYGRSAGAWVFLG
ncbi:MAG: hypothetical protein GTO00_09085 [Deltaproteobacteria bacterium]|nr:hypothetical protein [Deltaproteobacteria bacterium]